MRRSNERRRRPGSYRQGELLRLQGELADAERAYREASRRGCEPQPGLALLRLAQGRDRRRGRRDRPGRRGRRRLGRAGEASARLRRDHAGRRRPRAGAQRLRSSSTEIAARHGTPVCCARKRRRRAEPWTWPTATPAARCSGSAQAWKLWQELEAPYEAAQARVLVAQACRALGDDETAALELEAARAVFEQLGAAPDLARVDSLTGRAAAGETGGLTARELQVLRLRRRRPEQQGDRGRARPQQAHRRQAREQHLHQAPRLLARRGDLLRVRAQAHLSGAVGRTTHAATSEVGSFGRRGSLAPTAQSTVESTKWRDP